MDVIAIHDLHGVGDCSRLGRPHLDDRAMRQATRSSASCVSSRSSVRNNMRPIISCVTSTGEVAPVATTASSAAASAHIGVRVALPAGE